MRHLRIYRAIRLVRSLGSIRKAAESLTISPSALNRAIQAFEEELGAPVFERMSAGVRLSPAGELLFRMIDQHLSEMTEFQAFVGDMQDGLAGPLRVSIAGELSTGLVPQVLADFAAAAPGVALDVLTDDRTEALERHAVELAVTTRAVTGGDVEVLLAHRTALVTRGAEVDRISDLAGRRLILPPEGSGSRAAVDHLLRRHRLPAEAAIAFPGLWPLGPGPGGAVQILPAVALDPGTRTGARLGQVEISVLRRSRSPLSRAAQSLATRLQAALDAAEPA